MATNRTVYGIVIDSGEVRNGVIKVSISDDKDILDLAKEIGKDQQPPISGQHIRIWLVR